MQHGTTPDQRFVAGIEKAHRHEPDTVLLERLDALADGVRRFADAHHEGNVRTVHVSVEQSDAEAFSG